MAPETYDLEAWALRCRELLRERGVDLVAETCAWAVGLSDTMHLRRRHGRVVPTGDTLGERALAGQSLSGEEDAVLELGDAEPGTFRDALNALAPDGSIHLTRLDTEVLGPFALDTCVRAAEEARQADPVAWEELLDDIGDDGSDLGAVVRTLEWDAPLRIEAEQLVTAALGDVPLVQVEAEGLPLSLIRAAEALTRDAAPASMSSGPAGALDGARFLAEVAIRDAELPLPVPPERAPELLAALASQGLEEDEIVAVLADLPVGPDTAAQVTALVARRSTD